MPDVCKVVVAVDVDSMNLNFVTGASDIHQVMKDKDFFLSWDSTWGHRSRCLLDGEFLVISVDRLDFVDCVRTTRVAHDALCQTFLCLVWIRVEDGAFLVSTLASEVHLRILREDLSSLRDDAAELDQGIQVHFSQLPQPVFYRELVHPHVDLLMKFAVVRIDLLHNITCHRVQDRQHVRWLLCKPNGQCGLFSSQVSEINLERLLVVSTHVCDSVLVDVDTPVGKAA